ncbi:DUF1287 domain-containing protein [Pseudomonas sp. CrR25]|nr:DUF1287 domain-containing protein [Pseudomonas sp. CrR25]
MRVSLWVMLSWLLAFPVGAIEPLGLVLAAREQVGVTLSYDPAYRQLSYPGGDVPLTTGVCSDVLIRALRRQGLDLQEAVHRDMRAHFAAYPQRWGLRRPDPNIDHRRVPNLMTYFRRQGWALPESRVADGFRPGDIVAWDLGGGLTHIGILSDSRGAGGEPLVLHNIGHSTQEEDILLRFRIIGHYRFPGSG